MFLSKLKVIPFLLVSLLNIQTSVESDPQKQVTTFTNQSLVTFKSEELITGSEYKAYENSEWLVTLGGGQGYIGMSSFTGSKATLGNRTNLMAFDPSFSSKTTYVTALITKFSMKHINALSISRSNNSLYNYTGVTTYLVASDSLNGDYSLVTIVPSITTTQKIYEFATIKDEKYYALVFHNPSGVFALSNVEVNFYQSEEALTQVKSSSDLYFGAKYLITNNDSSVTFDTGVEDKTFSLGIGSEIDTYTFYNESLNLYLSHNEINEMILSETPSLFMISFNDGLEIKEYASGLYLSYDSETSMFVLKDEHDISLYLFDNSVDHNLEVTLFVREVLSKGENARGKCEEIYNYLLGAYNRLSSAAKEILDKSHESDALLAKERMSYLASYTNNVGAMVVNRKVATIKNGTIKLRITLSSSLFLIGIYIIKRRKGELA